MCIRDSRYNDAVETDVAVIFSTVDGEPPFERNMVSFSKVNGTITTINLVLYTKVYLCFGFIIRPFSVSVTFSKW